MELRDRKKRRLHTPPRAKRLFSSYGMQSAPRSRLRIGWELWRDLFGPAELVFLFVLVLFAGAFTVAVLGGGILIGSAVGRYANAPSEYVECRYLTTSGVRTNRKWRDPEALSIFGTACAFILLPESGDLGLGD